VWTQISVDEKRGLVYLPVESPTGDYYGGHPPGNDLFGESLVCVDLKTGERKWHYQLVHHPLWDMDISSAPILADINVDGARRGGGAAHQAGHPLCLRPRDRQARVAHRGEAGAARADVPGEWYSPTQPIPSKPPAYARNGVSVDDLIDFTPALRDQAQTLIAKYKIGPVFTPPVESKLDGPLATLTLGTASGGTNWPGGSYDPETHTVYAYACNACLTPIGLVRPPKELSDMDYVAGTAGSGSAHAHRPRRECRRRFAAVAVAGGAEAEDVAHLAACCRARAGGGGGGGGG
jgi:quinoprotein glucose dehydrogenase